jgi:hypothetical protein
MPSAQTYVTLAQNNQLSNGILLKNKLPAHRKLKKVSNPKYKFILFFIPRLKTKTAINKLIKAAINKTKFCIEKIIIYFN